MLDVNFCIVLAYSVPNLLVIHFRIFCILHFVGFIVFGLRIQELNLQLLTKQFWLSEACFRSCNFGMCNFFENLFVNLNELTENAVQKRGEEDKENVNPQVNQSTHVAKVSRSSKTTRPPQRYSPALNCLLLTDGGEPECYYGALQDENSSKQELVMKDEMDSLLGNQTWELTESPQRKKALCNKWVYRIKNEHDGSTRIKARLVFKGFQQKKCIDYSKIFSSIVKMSTIRPILGMVAAKNQHLEQLDVKTTFLHDDLEEDIYMSQLEGFINQGQESLVCKFRTSLYGLKQALRQ